MPWLIMAGRWALRLIGGWLPLGNKPIGEWLGKILWAVGIFIACMLVWNKITAPTGSIKTGSQKADSICNHYHQEILRPSFGCASLRVEEWRNATKTNAVVP